ncbi:MAG: hypothetical protein UR43_C0009G0013 [candidate division TM6 bacterium GW2011_GWF2_33_332]|nr:MAG: hypothetical protein UR43_C0009G0013 [candidate division TM6 bacterium GW2011_GWF2_33_332]
MIRKLIIAVFLAPILLFGQELTEKVVFDHTDLSDPEVKTIQVDMFSTTPTCNREVINKRVEVLFTVGDRYQYGNNSFYTKVQAVKLVPKVDGSPCPGAVVYTVELSEENPEMVIVYEINMGPNAINDFSIDVETEGYITDPVVQDSVRLEVSYKYEVVHYPDGTNDIAVNVPVSINNRVTFSWESDCYYKNYELQVLKLNNTSVAFANSDVGSSFQTIVDWSKALDIETHSDETEITLTLVEGDGYYLWRIRPISSYYDDGIANPDNWGTWSGTGSYIQGYKGGISGTGNYLFDFNQNLSDNVNWIYSRNFVEGDPDGESNLRIGEEVTFANGLSQVKQTQANLESQQKVVVAQTVYDYTGRPAVQSLAIPISRDSLGFLEDFMWSDRGTDSVYCERDFDADGNYQKPNRVIETNGFEYWSDLNADKYIPDADTVPFSQTTFYSGSGRVKEIASPGMDFSLDPDSPKTIRKYYSNVSDPELIRVFGYEAPHGFDCLKEITVDQNNVASVSYFDKAGRVIATCLTQRTDRNPSLLPIDSLGEAGFNVITSIGQNTESSGIISASNTFIVYEESTDVYIDYNITPALFGDSCTLCRTCDYKIYLLVAKIDGITDTIFYDTLTVNPQDICEGTYQYTIPRDTLNLPQGTYLISREIEPLNQHPDPSYSGEPMTYLQVYLDSIRWQLETDFQNDFGSMISGISNGDINDFYLSIDNSLDLVQENPDEYFAGDSLSLGYFGCDSIRIPIIVCPAEHCDIYLDSTYIYLEYFDQLYGTNYNDSTSTLAIFNNEYTRTNFENLIANMLAETDPSYTYECSQVWNCWQSIVMNYDAFVELDQSSDEYQMNLVDELLNCTGFMITNQAETETFALEHAYYSFYYDEENEECEDIASEEAVIDSLFYVFNEEFTSGEISSYILYNCVSHWNNNIDTDSITESTILECQRNCDDRRWEFDQAIRDEYYGAYLGPLYIEGDLYEVTCDTTNFVDPVWMVTDIPREYPSVYSLSLQQLNCYVNAAVDYCIDACSLTQQGNGSWGSPTELQNFYSAMVGSFEFGLINAGETGTWDTLSTKETYSEAFDVDSIEIFEDFQFGGDGTDELFDIIQSHDQKYFYKVGVSFSVSSTYGNLDDFAHSSGDYSVCKVDNEGQKIWDVSIGGDNSTGDHYDFLKKVIERKNGNLLLVGGSNSLNGGDKQDPRLGSLDFWIVEIDTSGNVICDTVFGGSEMDIPLDALEMRNGNLVFAGFSESDSCKYKSEYNIGDKDFWVILTDKDLNIIMEKTLGTEEEDYIFSVAEAFDGNILLAGSSRGDANPQGGKMEAGRGNEDFWIVKMFADTTGNIIWERTIGGANIDQATSIVEGNNQEITIAGVSSSNISGEKSENCQGFEDIWVLKLDRDGAILWDKTFGSSVSEGISISDGSPICAEKVSIIDVLPTKAGNCLIVGSANSVTTPVTDKREFDDYNHNGYVFWGLYIDKDGNYIWDRDFSGNGETSLHNFYTSSIQEFNRSFIIGGVSIDNSGNAKEENAYNSSYDFWTVNFGHECDSMAILFRWDSLPIIDTTGVDSIFVHTFEPVPCETDARQTILNEIYLQKNKIIAARLEEFENDYMSSCPNADNINDDFKAEYHQSYYHYTLYYYDRSGNLIKTVPPEGVKYDETVLTRDTFPEHQMVTKYEYNSLNQLTRQISPDAGETMFYYNGLQQLKVSVNAQQKADSTFSYIRYDELGRIVETGLGNETSGYWPDSLDSSTFPSTGTSQQTFTVYSVPNDEAVYLDANQQEFLDNRVSYGYTNDGVYTYYSYDPHGNVKWIIQDIPRLGKNYIEYEYDLVSGKVIKVKYNEGRKDQFFHRYFYDADNRIISTETSTDNKIWDKDAAYEYYFHGPLRRTSIGEDSIQGIDYTYTLQGWLKAINHPSLDYTMDQGNDGDLSGSNNFAPDAFGMELGYYSGDFKRPGSHIGTDNTYVLSGFDLYNGNISTWSHQFKVNDESPGIENYGKVQGYKYRYDELNRIKSSDYNYYNSGYQNTASFETSYIYDFNGNIENMTRNDNAGNPMDNIFYSYGIGRNRLNKVNDLVSTPSNTADLEGLLNYVFDSIGNLAKSEDEGIDTIIWNVYGKVAEVIKTDNELYGPNLKFTYDAMGNRVIKEVIFPADTMLNVTTFYVRDAQGNILANYDRTYEDEVKEIYTLTEQPIYGSSRIGMRIEPIQVKLIDHSTQTTVNIADNNEIERVSENSNLSIILQKSNLLSVAPVSLYATHLSLSPTALLPYAGYNTGKVDIDIDRQEPIVGTVSTLVQGKAGHIYKAEDKYGIEYFTAVSRTPMIATHNRIYVFDRNNHLISGCSGMYGNEFCELGGMRETESNVDFYLFTIHTNGKPYYHTIRTGVSNLVLSKNNLIDNTSGYGQTMAVLADYVNGNSRLFLRRYNSGNCQLVYVPVTSSSTGTPIQIDEFATADATGKGQIKISIDGTMLAIANTTNSVPYNYESEIRLYTINQTHDTLSLKDSYEIDNYVVQNIDFSPENEYIYFVGKGMGNSPAKRLKISTGVIDDVNEIENKGDVIRTKNDAMALCEINKYSIKTVSTPEAGAIISSMVDDLTVCASPWKTTGTLPTQTHSIYTSTDYLFARDLGNKRYEITDHLGNVRVVFSDIKGSSLNGFYQPTEYFANVTSGVDYDPFGMQLLLRTYNSGDYRFGFNGKENENEWDGQTGSKLDFGARIYDSRLGRWFSVDPLASKFSNLSSYNFTSNNPIIFIDNDGEDFGVKVNNSEKTIIITATVYTTNQKAYEQALKASNKWNLIKSKYNGYSVGVEINVVYVTPSNEEVTSYFSSIKFYRKNGNIKKSLLNKWKNKYIRSMAERSAMMDPTGNLYSGNKGPHSEGVTGDSFTGGVTANGKYISMNTHDIFGDMGEFIELVIHEFGHLFGLDDIGGKYYSPGGTMEYSNPMKDISDKDIQNILKYSIDFFGGLVPSSGNSNVVGEFCGDPGENPFGIGSASTSKSEPEQGKVTTTSGGVSWNEL